MMKTRAVFLDRDGTLNADFGYVGRQEDFVFLDGVKQAVKQLKKSGFLIFVVSNQSGVGRGYFSRDAVEEVHRKLREELQKEGAPVDGIYFCPHRPEEKCGCRKPSPAMAREAAAQFGVDLKRSYFVGDKESDVKTGRAAGCRTVLISPLGKNAGGDAKADFAARDLAEAARWIVDDSKGRKQ